MTDWHSIKLKILYKVLGWIAFVSWSISYYPQIILNYRRKSVVGLNFEFVILNFTKHSLYLTYNMALFFSHTVQAQYHHKYGPNEMIPVALNDIALSTHVVLLIGFTLFQIFIYKKNNQRFSKVVICIVCVAWLIAIVWVLLAIKTHAWLRVISIFNMIQAGVTFIKFVPQAILNCRLKSTQGFSIGFVLLDLLGAVNNCLQMAVQSIDQRSWVNFLGNLGKALPLVSIFFDTIFIIQHYVLYPTKNTNYTNDELPIQSST